MYILRKKFHFKIQAENVGFYFQIQSLISLFANTYNTFTVSGRAVGSVSRTGCYRTHQTPRK